MLHDLGFTSPAQTLDIVDVNMRAFGNGSAGIANFAAIFQDVFLLSHIPHGNFVTKRNIIDQFDRGDRFSFQGHRLDLFASLQVHGGHADVIIWLRVIKYLFS